MSITNERLMSITTERLVAEELFRSLETNASASGTVWKKLGDALLASGILNGRRDGDKKQHTKEFNASFTAYLDATVGSQVPDEGYDRTGKKLISLKKKDGSVKWSAWQVSSRMMQYLTELSSMQYYGEEMYITDPVSLHRELKSRAEILGILGKYRAIDTTAGESDTVGGGVGEECKVEMDLSAECMASIMKIKELIIKITDPQDLDVIKKEMEGAYIVVINWTS